MLKTLHVHDSDSHLEIVDTSEMNQVKDSLFDLERHRRRLEENITELRQSLQHWRTWDAEYEALKEEVDAVAGDSHSAELERIQQEFEGDLVNSKEVKEIFGAKGQRSRDQIISVLDHRIDYVTKSIQSLQKQLEQVENKHATASIVSQPDAQDDEGRPITEIVEELDEEDNVLSYKLNRPGESLNHVRDALQKAGVKELPQEEEKEGQPSGGNGESSAAPAEPAEPKPSTSQAHSPHPASNVTAGKQSKKGVSFAEEVESPVEDLPPKSRNAIRVENIMQSAKDQEDITKQEPVIPENEDPDDAALRRDMLNYSMGQMGAVVAELDLEEGDSDEWEYSDEGFDEEEDDEDDDEDKYGRYTGRVVTDDYRQRMLELEQKLGIQSRFTAEKKPQADDDSDSDDDRIGRIVVKQEEMPSSSAARPVPTESAIKSDAGKQSEGGTAKKGVRFADNLDIAPDDQPVSLPIREKEDLVEPLSEKIVERSSHDKATEVKPARKPSRFKKTRNENTQLGFIPRGPLDVANGFREEEPPKVPTGPEGATISQTLVERETVPKPRDDNEDEDIVDRSELAEHHQRLRRKFIQQQGGFLKEEEESIKYLDEDDEEPEPVSRFKAARLSKH